MKPAARAGDQHKCPKTGHEDGKISAGASQVLIEGQPAARVGDTIQCADGSSQQITEGSSCVMIEGKPAARLGDGSQHGGTISSGASNVFIGTGGNTRVNIGPGVKIGGNGNKVFIGGATLQSTATQATLPPVATASCDCPAIWQILNKETRVISQEADPIKRNRKISAAYAKLYQTNKDLRWSGVAALASKQVGCGLQQTNTMRADIAKKLKTNQISQLSEKNVRNLSMLSAEYNQLMFKDSIVETMQKGLVVGNKAVFEEIYPVLQFYQRYGLTKFKNCAADYISLTVDSNKTLSKLLIVGLEKIDSGKVDAGTEKILRHEQQDTLQKAIYADLEFAHALEFNQMADKAHIGKLFGAQPIKLSFSAACQGGKEVSFEGWNLADFEERWPYAQTVAKTFTELEQQDPALIGQIIQQIAEQA